LALARKKKCPEHVDHERWLVSYADFITLLFAFFVVMYATASINLGKYKILSDSLYGAFRGEPRVPEPIQIGIVSKSPNLNTHLKKKVKERMKKKIEIQKFTNVSELKGGKSQEEQKKKQIQTTKIESAKTKEIVSKKSKKSKTTETNKNKNLKKQQSTSDVNKSQKGESHKDKVSRVEKIKSQNKGMKTKEKVLMGKLMAKIAQKMKKQFSNLINKERVNIRHNNKFIAVELNNNFFFNKGDYVFKKEAIPVVGRIVDVLNRYPNFPIIIEGHTGINTTDTTDKHSAWELAALRATGLVHILTDFSIAPDRITASAFAEFKPSYNNETPEGRRKNRRTTILIKADPQNTQFLRLLRKLPNVDYSRIYDFTE